MVNTRMYISILLIRILNRREYVITGYTARIRREPNVLTKSKCNRRVREAKEKICKFKKVLQ